MKGTSGLCYEENKVDTALIRIYKYDGKHSEMAVWVLFHDSRKPKRRRSREGSVCREVGKMEVKH